jgi:hypothetical protein
MKCKLKHLKLVLFNLILEQLFSVCHLQSWCQFCFSSLLFHWMPLHYTFLPFNNLVWQYTWLHHTWMLDAASKFTVTQLESLIPCTSVQVTSFINILIASRWTSVSLASRTIQKVGREACGVSRAVVPTNSDMWPVSHSHNPASSSRLSVPSRPSIWEQSVRVDHRHLLIQARQYET